MKRKLNLILCFGLLWGGGAEAVEDPWMMVCEARPERLVSRAMTAKSWAREANQAPVEPGWTSEGKAPFVTLHAISHTRTGEGGATQLDLLVPEGGPGTNLAGYVTLVVIEDRPTILWGDNYKRAEVIRRFHGLKLEVLKGDLTWRSGELQATCNVRPDKAAYGEQFTVLRGSWVFRAVRLSEYKKEQAEKAGHRQGGMKG